MLIKCPECNKEISDTAPSCPNCGYLLQTRQESTSVGHISLKKKTAIFQIIALGAIFVALFTPRILVTMPCLVIITSGIISLFRKEPRWLLSVIFIISGILILNTSSLDYNYDDNYANNLEVSKWDWTAERNYSYIRGRVKNTGTKTVTYFEIKAFYLDDSGNVLDTDSTVEGDDLLPGMSKEFEIMHKESSEYKKAQISIEKARTK